MSIRTKMIRIISFFCFICYINQITNVILRPRRLSTKHGAFEHMIFIPKDISFWLMWLARKEIFILSVAVYISSPYIISPKEISTLSIFFIFNAYYEQPSCLKEANEAEKLNQISGNNKRRRRRRNNNKMIVFRYSIVFICVYIYIYSYFIA